MHDLLGVRKRECLIRHILGWASARLTSARTPQHTELGCQASCLGGGRAGDPRASVATALTWLTYIAISGISLTAKTAWSVAVAPHIEHCPRLQHTRPSQELAEEGTFELATTNVASTRLCAPDPEGRSVPWAVAGLIPTNNSNPSITMPAAKVRIVVAAQIIESRHSAGTYRRVIQVSTVARSSEIWSSSDYQ